MKACPTCFRLYPADAGFCAQDGSPLLGHEEVPCQVNPDDRLLGTQVLARYEIRRIVADGGMGRVYEARDMQLDKRVAIKVLHPEIARDQIALERFKREYEISKDLPHDHIVEVLDFQQMPADVGGRYVMVMEFLDGEELRALLKREPRTSPAKMARILSHVAIGLDEAHRRQFVHRDLKPDNLFLCDSEAGPIVKLLDFGSVRINKNRQMSKLTSLGTTIGSPFYMSPEQAQGKEDLDHRADVFALAAITYESISGQVPFMGSNGPAILLAILTKNPPPLSTKATTPAALDDVIDDALAKNPDMRTASIGAFADAFGRAFGLDGDHHEWATTPVGELESKIAAHRPVAAASNSVADPFAADPFAAPKPAAGGAPPFVAPPPPPAGPTAAVAMDDAFNAASMEAAGVPQRPMLFLVIGAVIAVAALVGILVFALRG